MSREILVLVFLFLSSNSFAQNLEVILSKTKLPVPIFAMPVVYDGEDSIYVLGGSGPNGHERDILKFDVTTELVQKVGTMDPIAFGSAVWADDKSILYFGGHDGFNYVSKIWSYKPDGSSDWTHVGDLPRDAGYTSSILGHGHDEYSYIFGGYGNSESWVNTISKYSSLTKNSTVVGDLPGERIGTSAVFDQSTGDAYIFGGNCNSSQSLNDIVKFNPDEKTVVKLNVTLPVATRTFCAVWTGFEAYIIGGPMIGEGQSLKVARFNPSKNEVLDLPVNNFPSPLTYHACAFVPKLNRIYIFGGYPISGARRDDILYIDLPGSPTIPTTTPPITTTTKRPGSPIDCSNEVDGTRLPNPFCCESYYQCENREAVRRQCPSLLHFNPSHAECDLPEIVKCRLHYE